MRVVIDTNVVASTIFFGGKPKEVIDRVMTNQIDAYASADILEEHSETVEYLKDKFPGKKPKILLIDKRIISELQDNRSNIRPDDFSILCKLFRIYINI